VKEKDRQINNIGPVKCTVHGEGKQKEALPLPIKYAHEILEGFRGLCGYMYS